MCMLQNMCLHPALIVHSTTRFLNTSADTTKICGSTKIQPGGNDFTFWPMDYLVTVYETNMNFVLGLSIQINPQPIF